MFFSKEMRGLKLGFFPNSELSLSLKENEQTFEKKRCFRHARFDAKSMRELRWYFVFSVENSYTQELDASNTEKKNRRVVGDPTMVC